MLYTEHACYLLNIACIAYRSATVAMHMTAKYRPLRTRDARNAANFRVKIERSFARLHAASINAVAYSDKIAAG